MVRIVHIVEDITAATVLLDDFRYNEDEELMTRALDKLEDAKSALEELL